MFLFLIFLSPSLKFVFLPTSYTFFLTVIPLDLSFPRFYKSDSFRILFPCPFHYNILQMGLCYCIKSTYKPTYSGFWTQFFFGHILVHKQCLYQRKFRSRFFLSNTSHKTCGTKSRFIRQETPVFNTR